MGKKGRLGWYEIKKRKEGTQEKRNEEETRPIAISRVLTLKN